MSTPLAMSSAATLVGRALEHLAAIEHTLGRLLELQQAPRLNFLAAGSVAGGGVAGIAPQAVMAANPRRRGLSVQNNAAAGSLTVGLGVTTPLAGTGLVLAPGQTWDGRVSGDMWLGSVAVVASQANVPFSWLQVSGPSSRRQNEAI